MKYTYAYKTSDGTRHEASTNAESREAVFAKLRKQGIKAIKVVATDGSKANGEIRGIRKRVLVASIIGTAVLVGVVGYLVIPRTVPSSVPEGELTGYLTAQLRRQVIGDAGVIEKGEKDGWRDVFDQEGERFLASFAIPGIPAGVGSTTEKEVKDALARKIDIAPGDGIEAQQIKAMVEGMKSEARLFISKGGSLAQYCRLLVKRQEEEIAYHNRAKMEINTAHKSGMSRQELDDLWEKHNESLRQIGVKLVPMPE